MLYFLDMLISKKRSKSAQYDESIHNTDSGAYNSRCYR